MCFSDCLGPCGAEKTVVSSTGWVFGVLWCGGLEGFGRRIAGNARFLSFLGASLRMIGCGGGGL